MIALTLRRRALMMARGGGIDVAAMAISYTGEFTDEIKTMGDGKTYRLLTLIKSGMLTLESEVSADVWMIGGGANGQTASNGDGFGGAGGYSKYLPGVMLKALTATIGAAKGSTSLSGDISATTGATSTRNGGTGGGCPAYSSSSYKGGTGDGLSKYPFEDTTMTLLGGGGGAGAVADEQDGWVSDDGDGGTNGGSGKKGTRDTYDTYTHHGGAGGKGGGGDGGDAAENWAKCTAGENGTLYGAGGGAAGYQYLEDDDTASFRANGSGYQGVCYIRIPLDQAA